MSAHGTCFHACAIDSRGMHRSYTFLPLFFGAAICKAFFEWPAKAFEVRHVTLTWHMTDVDAQTNAQQPKQPNAIASSLSSPVLRSVAMTVMKKEDCWHQGHDGESLGKPCMLQQMMMIQRAVRHLYMRMLV